MSIETDILRVLPLDRWCSARDVHVMIGQWSRTAVRNKLADLLHIGRVERDGVELGYRYRLKSETQQ